MKRKLFMTALATSLAIPAVVASVPFNVEASGKEFTDVPKTNPFYIEISQMTNEGVINGYTDGTFKPQQAISRMHVAMLFERSLDLVPIRAGKEFTDVPKTHRAYEVVQKVYRAGIFDGKTNGNFGIADNLTRAQMAKVLHDAFDLETHTGYIFSDVGEDHWAKDHIASLYMSGITVGSNGKYLPNDSVTRAHYAAFLYRALNPDKAPTPDKRLHPTPVPPSVPISPVHDALNKAYGAENVTVGKNGMYTLSVGGSTEAVATVRNFDIYSYNSDAAYRRAAKAISQLSGKATESEVYGLISDYKLTRQPELTRKGITVTFTGSSLYFGW